MADYFHFIVAQGPQNGRSQRARRSNETYESLMGGQRTTIHARTDPAAKLPDSLTELVRARYQADAEQKSLSAQIAFKQRRHDYLTREPKDKKELLTLPPDDHTEQWAQMGALQVHFIPIARASKARARFMYDEPSEQDIQDRRRELIDAANKIGDEIQELNDRVKEIKESKVDQLEEIKLALQQELNKEFLAQDPKSLRADTTQKLGNHSNIPRIQRLLILAKREADRANQYLRNIYASLELADPQTATISSAQELLRNKLQQAELSTEDLERYNKLAIELIRAQYHLQRMQKILSKAKKTEVLLHEDYRLIAREPHLSQHLLPMLLSSPEQGLLDLVRHIICESCSADLDYLTQEEFTHFLFEVEDCNGENLAARLISICTDSLPQVNDDKDRKACQEGAVKLTALINTHAPAKPQAIIAKKPLSYRPGANDDLAITVTGRRLTLNERSVNLRPEKPKIQPTTSKAKEKEPVMVVTIDKTEFANALKKYRESENAYQRTGRLSSWTSKNSGTMNDLLKLATNTSGSHIAVDLILGILRRHKRDLKLFTQPVADKADADYNTATDHIISDLGQLGKRMTPFNGA